MEPDDLVSAAEIGTWTDLHERQVRKLAEKGVIQRDGKGRYRLQATVRTINIRAREQAAGRLGGDDGDTPDLPHERALLARAQREGQVMRNAIMRAELIPTRDMEEVLGGVCSVIRTNFLGLPTRLAPRLVSETTAAAVYEILYEAVCAVLQAIADTEVIVMQEEVKARAIQRAGSKTDLIETQKAADPDV